jgi:hypothetical protein
VRGGGIYRAAQPAANPHDASRMSEPIPARISDEGRTATWNPALTRAAHVVLRVRRPDGALEERRSMNSGRAKVREGERIEAVVAGEG